MADASSPDMLAYERDAWQRGCGPVAGVDEVGRGPLAGPVVAAAVLFYDLGSVPDGVDDSKRLSASRRSALATELLEHPQVAVGIGWCEPAEIDRVNILRATHRAMRRALEDLPATPRFALVDGRPVPGLPCPHQAIVRGDSLSASIAAASIVAKVHRDTLMVELEARYPGYGFARHKGYGTRDHMSALRRLGPSPVHRQSFAPVAACREGVPVQQHLGLE